MAQISLYIEDSVIARLSAAAKERNCSISKYVAFLIGEQLSKEDQDAAKRKQILMGLCGSIGDESFAGPLEARTPRR